MFGGKEEEGAGGEQAEGKLNNNSAETACRYVVWFPGRQSENQRKLNILRFIGFY